MGKSKLFHSGLSLKWLSLRKFIFLFPLQTGVQIYGFISFVSSILIADFFLTKLIDEQICSVYSKAGTSQCISTKHIIVPQACQAFMSALLLCFVKRASVPLCWVGCKFAVSLIEFNYILHWTRDLFVLYFNFHLHLAWFAVTFICVDLYGVLVAFSYYTELVGNQATYNFSPEETVEANGIPVPPDLPNF